MADGHAPVLKLCGCSRREMEQRVGLEKRRLYHVALELNNLCATDDEDSVHLVNRMKIPTRSITSHIVRSTGEPVHSVYNAALVTAR
jgi:hypothetical protein